MNLEVYNANMITLNSCYIHETVDINFINNDNIQNKGLCLLKTKILGQLYIRGNSDKFKKLIKNGKYYEHKFNGGKNIWKEIQPTNEQIAEQFVLLKENFHNLGQYDDEDAAYVEFKRYQIKSKLAEAKTSNMFNKVLEYIRYGFKKLLYDWVGGYGDIQPVSDSAKLLSVFEGFCGIF